MRNLYLGVLLAPYRLDYYNYIYENMNCDIYFQLRNFEGQLFSTDDLEKRCVFTPKYLNIKRVFGDRQVVKNLRTLIQKSNPEFIIVPEFSLLAIQVILIKKVYGYKYRIISQCDDSLGMLEHKGFSRFHTWSRKLCMKTIDELVLLDSKAKDWYQKRYHKGIFMPLIVDERQQDIEKVSMAKHLANELKDKYGLHDCKTLLFVGRLVDQKNLASLIDACRLLNMPYKLIIVGDGILRPELEKHALERKIPIEFVGRKNGDELNAWYYCADVFVLPSKIEPFGAVVNEALLCGCNCCVSKVAGSACLINEGENGFLLDPYDVHDIADKIKKTCSLQAEVNRSSKMFYSFKEMMDNMYKHIMVK